MKNCVFWLSALCFFGAINTIGAVMSAGIPVIDPGSGFITFSPAIDYVVWSFVAVPSGLVMAWALWSEGLGLAQFPELLRFPVAYGATLGVLSVVVVVLGMLDLTYPHGGRQIPLWWYVGLLAGCYLLAGFLGGWSWSRRLGYDLLWGGAITGLIVGLGLCLLQVTKQEGTCILNNSIGNVLGRVNLPACVVMDSYESSLRERGFDRDRVTQLVCLLPPALFTAGWVTGRLARGRGRRAEK